MLFMGEEYGEPAPFPFFVDHGDPTLLEAVRRGRRDEFARSEWTEAVADPADPATFAGAVLDPARAASGAAPPGARRLHRAARRCGAGTPCCTAAAADQVVDAPRRRRRRRPALGPGSASVLAVNARRRSRSTSTSATGWMIAFDTTDPRWGGSDVGVELADGRLTLAGITAALLVS